MTFSCSCQSLDWLLGSAIAVEGMTSLRSLAIWTVPPLTGSPVDRFTISPEVAALSVPFPCGRRSLDGLLGL